MDISSDRQHEQKKAPSSKPTIQVRNSPIFPAQTRMSEVRVLKAELSPGYAREKHLTLDSHCGTGFALHWEALSFSSFT